MEYVLYRYVDIYIMMDIQSYGGNTVFNLNGIYKINIFYQFILINW